MLQFNHFNFNVLDLERSLAFYQMCIRDSTRNTAAASTA